MHSHNPNNTRTMSKQRMTAKEIEHIIETGIRENNEVSDISKMIAEAYAQQQPRWVSDEPPLDEVVFAMTESKDRIYLMMYCEVDRGFDEDSGKMITYHGWCCVYDTPYYDPKKGKWDSDDVQYDDEYEIKYWMSLPKSTTHIFNREQREAVDTEECDHPYYSVIGEEHGNPHCLKCHEYLNNNSR
jgi:hypothetical protein